MIKKIRKIVNIENIMFVIDKIFGFFDRKYRNMVIGGIIIVGIILALGAIFTAPKTSLIDVYEENNITRTYKMHNDMIPDYHRLMLDLKKLSYKYGFFTVREFKANSPEFKIFVVYFKNNEAFSVSIEPVLDEYLYVYRLGRLDEDGNYKKSGNGEIRYSGNEWNKLRDVIVKFLFGRVPVDINSVESINKN